MKGAIDTGRLMAETGTQMLKDKALTAMQNEAVTQAGITTSPSAATPRPAMSEAAVDWVAP